MLPVAPDAAEVLFHVVDAAYEKRSIPLTSNIHQLRAVQSLGEEMARQFNRWSGVSTIGLRFSNIMVRAYYDRFPTFSVDPHRRKWNLWGYVDELINRDAGKTSASRARRGDRHAQGHDA